MKCTLFALFVLCASTAFGQAAAMLSPQVQPPTFYEHPEHASHHTLAAEQSIIGGAPDTYGYAQGEQPLWQFGPMKEPTPLGDVARAYRKEKMTGKKAEIVFEKQGS